MIRASLFGAVSLLVTLVAQPARAATITWQGAAECRRELEVAEQVETMTGRRLAEIDSADFELALEAFDSTRLQLSLTTLGRDGQRSTRVLEGPSCAEVTDAAAVAIALTVGNTRENPEPEPVPASATPAPPAKEQPPPEDEPTLPAEVQSSAVVFRLGAAVALDTSATPELVPGGALRWGVARSNLRAELEAALYAPGRTVDDAGEGGSFQLGYVAPLLCGERRLGTPSALLCAGYELGQLSAEGEGVSTSRLRRTFWHGPRAELGLSWPLSKDLSLTARVGGVLPLSRHAFVLDASRAVHRAGTFSLRAGLGVEMAL